MTQAVGQASAAQARAALAGWFRERHPDLPPGEPAGDTPLISSRLLTSLQVVDLITFVEALRGAPVTADDLRPGVFATLDSIVASFLGGEE